MINEHVLTRSNGCEVQRSLNLNEPHPNFTRTFPDDIDAMYKMCAYDYAMAVPSPWCAVFTNSDLQLLELKEDVISAEMYGYEDEINKLETCVLMKDFVNRLYVLALSLSLCLPPN